MKNTLIRNFVEAVKSARANKIKTAIASVYAEERNNPGTAIAVVKGAADLLGVSFRRESLQNSFSTNLIFTVGEKTKRLDYTGNEYKSVVTPAAICSLLVMLSDEFLKGRSLRWSSNSGQYSDYIPASGSERAGYFLFLRAVYHYNAKHAFQRSCELLSA